MSYRDFGERMRRTQAAVDPYRGVRAATSWVFVSQSRRGGLGVMDFENDWIDDDDYPAMFKMDSNGEVKLRGVLTGGVPGTVAFTLPPGYWPNKARPFPAALLGGGQSNVVVMPDGTVVVAAE